MRLKGIEIARPVKRPAFKPKIVVRKKIKDQIYETIIDPTPRVETKPRKPHKKGRSHNRTHGRKKFRPGFKKKVIPEVMDLGEGKEAGYKLYDLIYAVGQNSGSSSTDMGAFTSV